MKKMMVLLLLSILIIYLPVFAGDDPVKKHIANSLTLIFAVTGKKSNATAGNYRQKKFVYNGMQVMACQCKKTQWTGYFKTLAIQDLPSKAQVYLKSRYADNKVKKVIMFFNDAADITYFAEVEETGKRFILKIQPSGRTTFFI